MLIACINKIRKLIKHVITIFNYFITDKYVIDASIKLMISNANQNFLVNKNGN